jgi:hypothetical protein
MDSCTHIQESVARQVHHSISSPLVTGTSVNTKFSRPSPAWMNCYLALPEGHLRIVATVSHIKHQHRKTSPWHLFNASKQYLAYFMLSLMETQRWRPCRRKQPLRNRFWHINNMEGEFLLSRRPANDQRISEQDHSVMGSEGRQGD